MYTVTDKSAAIKEIKKYLYTLNQTIYPSVRRVSIDGQYDEQTRKAVIDFQKLMGYKQTGIVDYKTYTAMYDEYLSALDESSSNKITYDGGFPLSIGDMNEDVRLLHIFINELADVYSSIKKVRTSSYYSTETAEAVLSLSKIFMLKETTSTDKGMMRRIIYDAKNASPMF